MTILTYPLRTISPFRVNLFTTQNNRSARTETISGNLTSNKCTFFISFEQCYAVMETLITHCGKKNQLICCAKWSIC